MERREKESKKQMMKSATFQQSPKQVYWRKRRRGFDIGFWVGCFPLPSGPLIMVIKSWFQSRSLLLHNTLKMVSYILLFPSNCSKACCKVSFAALTLDLPTPKEITPLVFKNLHFYPIILSFWPGGWGEVGGDDVGTWAFPVATLSVLINLWHFHLIP